MNKNFYNLLQEKINWKKKKIRRYLIPEREISGGNEREKLLEEYKKVTEDLKITQQHLESELTSETSKKTGFWNRKK